MINKNFNKYYKICYKFKEESNESDISIIKEELLKDNEGKILDLGCGYGRISNLLMKQGFNIYSIDYYDQFLNEAKGNSINTENYTLGDFTDIQKYYDCESFDSIYSLYSSIGHESKDSDEKIFHGVSSVLKKGGKFLLEYENITFHSQFNNLIKHDYYEIDDKYRRILDIQVDLYDSKVNIGNELWDLKENKKLIDWKFHLNLYSIYELKQIGKKYGLSLEKVRGRFSNSEAFWYEPQIILVFKKKLTLQ